MTAIPARLGARQVAVLRAAAAGTLARFNDDGWDANGHACTQPARRVAELGLLAEGERMALVTGGSWKTRHGVWMVLSEAGQAALDAWELANPQTVIAHLRHTAAIKALAAKPGPITDGDLLTLAANDPTLGDGPFSPIARAVDCDPILDDDEWD